MAMSKWPLGLLAGAGLMFFLDPDTGRRRRALARDRVAASMADIEDGLDAAARDAGNRVRGFVASMRRQFAGEAVDDMVLAERVRSRIGRAIRHPGAVDVWATDGIITLRGDGLEHEMDALLHAVESVPGVRRVENRMQIHRSANDIPGLQGEGHRLEAPIEFLQEHWSPGARALAVIVGFCLALSGLLSRQRFAGTLLALAGSSLAARGLTNLSLRRLTGIGAGRRGVELQKTLQIKAPLDRVFTLWTNYDHFPRFMSHVLEVRAEDGGRSHWKVQGPAGVTVQWDAVITRHEQNRVLAWKTLPGSPIQHSGIVYFEPAGDDVTRVDIKLAYNPAIGGLGHLLAGLFRVDPRTQMDDDLMRMKQFIETGRTPHDAAMREVRVAES